ncbi:MAG TPA: hypothetical protein DCM08_01945, partial [Microscillaceae bacterium]|nr:hypothetical protein [Microscillaceae bacterium]
TRCLCDWSSDVCSSDLGVQEYWIIFPSEHVLQQYILNEQGKYVLNNSFTEDEVFNAQILPDLQIDLAEIFEE